MKWTLILVLSVTNSVEVKTVDFQSRNLCQVALREIQAAPPSMGGNAWWIGKPQTVTGEPTAQNHEVLLRGAYCVQTDE